MENDVYSYVFAPSVDLDEVRASLVLALIATEALHGESATRLDATHRVDLDSRSCTIDTRTPVGRDLNRLFLHFLAREFGDDAFRVERGDGSLSTRTACGGNGAVTCYTPR